MSEDLDTKLARNARLRAVGKMKGCGSPRLGSVAEQQWPTARTDMHKFGNAGTDRDRGRSNIEDAAWASMERLWATPQANADAGSRNCEGSAAHQGTSLADQVTTGSSQTGRQGNKRRLNPRFVAWLMGFDPDWCAELSRVDALRCYGNAVVPAQGAYAIRLLVEALEEDTA